MLDENVQIVEEAYRIQFNIKPTARKYNVYSEQIRRWKKRYDEELNSNKMTDVEKQDALSLKILQPQSPHRKDPQDYVQLRLYYDNLRNRD